MIAKRNGIILWANQILACVRLLEERKQEKKAKTLNVFFFLFFVRVQVNWFTNCYLIWNIFWAFSGRLRSRNSQTWEIKINVSLQKKKKRRKLDRIMRMNDVLSRKTVWCFSSKRLTDITLTSYQIKRKA